MMHAQLVGGIAGALLEVALVPGLSWAWFGRHNKTHAPGCFYPGAVNNWELFLWELVLTFIFVRSSSGPLHILLASCTARLWRQQCRPTVLWSSSSAYTAICGVAPATAEPSPSRNAPQQWQPHLEWCASCNQVNGWSCAAHASSAMRRCTWCTPSRSLSRATATSALS